MAKYASQLVLQNGPNYVKNNAIRMALVRAYAFGDTAAVALAAANKIGEIVMAPADYVLGQSGNNCTLTIGAKSGAAANASGAAADHHIIHHDNAGNILLVTDETGEAVNAAGDTVNYPSHVYTAPQPT